MAEITAATIPVWAAVIHHVTDRVLIVLNAIPMQAIQAMQTTAVTNAVQIMEAASIRVTITVLSNVVKVQVIVRNGWSAAVNLPLNRQKEDLKEEEIMEEGMEVVMVMVEEDSKES